MRRTQVYLHKYPRYVRIRVLESSLVQRASRDNPRGIKPSVILVGGLDRGENQKSPGMAKGGGKDKQESRVARGQPRDSPPWERRSRKRLSGTGQLGLGPYNAHLPLLSIIVPKISSFPPPLVCQSNEGAIRFFTNFFSSFYLLFLFLFILYYVIFYFIFIYYPFIFPEFFLINSFFEEHSARFDF